MAPVELTDDYYAILEVSQTATPEEVRKSYQRLAKALHPDKNLNKPGATASFQLLGRAYETIKAPEKRSAYDTKWLGIRDMQARQREAEMRKTKRRQASAEAKRKKEAFEKAIRRKKSIAREERPRESKRRNAICDGDNSEATRSIRRLAADIQQLKNP
ncbi:hypothetical protein MMC20_003270 [Loxospora ochrophaea]|nr:hypothetical protein [Loxospora ochrophaea]